MLGTDIGAKHQVIVLPPGSKVMPQKATDLSDQFDEWRNDHTTGDPDAPKHRTDDPGVIAKMREATERGGGSA